MTLIAESRGSTDDANELDALKLVADAETSQNLDASIGRQGRTWQRRTVASLPWDSGHQRKTHVRHKHSDV